MIAALCESELIKVSLKLMTKTIETNNYCATLICRLIHRRCVAFFSRSLGINLYRVEVIHSARNRIYTCDKVSLNESEIEASEKREKKNDDYFQCYFIVNETLISCSMKM